MSDTLKPYLVLIDGDGTAPYEVADVLRCERCDVNTHGECCQECPQRWGVDEVRDFHAIPRRLARRFFTLHKIDGLVDEMAAVLCNEPGGTEMLCNAVLPEAPFHGTSRAYREHMPELFSGTSEWHGLPDRLAILAPKAPDLLRERVEQWGGESWRAYTITPESGRGATCIYYCISTPRGIFDGPDWPTVTRAALAGAR